MPKPHLPENCDPSCSANGWLYDPQDTSNGHVWRAQETSVGVFNPVGTPSVRVRDDRARGFGASIELERFEDGTVADAVAYACEWMQMTDAGEWSHPRVCEAVFDAPAGYELEAYYVEEQESDVYYRRTDFEGEPPRSVKLEGPDALTVDNAPYLHLHVWNSSGNASVCLAPWTCAHGLKCRHPEVLEVAETPDECGLEVAVTVARRWAREHVGGEIDTTATGQADLGVWSA